MQNQENNNTIFAGFFVRLAAFILDSLFIGIALLIVKMPMWIITLFQSDNILKQPLLFKFSFWDILLYLLGVFYFVIMTYTTGATLGKRAFCLKVVPKEEEKLTLINVIYRETIGRYLSSVIMCIGYFLIAVDSEKRALHDMMCDTRVVYQFKKNEKFEPKRETLIESEVVMESQPKLRELVKEEEEPFE